MTTYKFSILMANYNNGRFIAGAIKSVLKQTYRNWELVIVDDASEDDSLIIINGFLEDKRIKLCAEKKHEGCGVAKKICASHATGEILCELDPDDILHEMALEKVCDFYGKNPDCGFVHTNYFECDELLNIKGISSWSKTYDAKLTNLLEPMSSPFRTFRKAAYEKTSGYDDELERAVDKDIVYKLEEVAKIGFINEPLYYYRMHQGGISSGNNSWKARVWDSRAKHNAYKRRAGTAIPNLSEEQAAEDLCGAIVRSVAVRDLMNATFLFKEARKMGLGIFSIFKKIIVISTNIINKTL
jgi:glycosyltransferase involved in cell wall biosynthesis